MLVSQLGSLLLFYHSSTTMSTIDRKKKYKFIQPHTLMQNVAAGTIGCRHATGVEYETGKSSAAEPE